MKKVIVMMLFITTHKIVMTQNVAIGTSILMHLLCLRLSAIQKEWLQKGWMVTSQRKATGYSVLF
jgi:hypothetical protein